MTPTTIETQEVHVVSKSVLYMSMSLDGFIAGPNDDPSNPGGDDFMRLHEWYGFPSDRGPNADDTRQGLANTFWTKSRPPVRSSRVVIPWNRSITGAVITTTASESSWRVTARRAHRSRGTRW